MTPLAARRRAPRLVVKVVGFSFAVTACVLGAVFVMLTWQTRERLTRAVADSLEQSQRRFADLQARQRREHVLQAIALSENPTLKAALDTYNSERSAGTAAERLTPTIASELDKLQQLLGIDIDALSVLDVKGVILASAGPMRSDWPAGEQLHEPIDSSGEPSEEVIRRGSTVFLATGVPMLLGDDVIGALVLAEPLDDEYAQELAGEGSTEIAILIDGRVVASSLSLTLRDEIARVELPESGPTTIGSEEFVVQRLSAVDTASVYALGSVTASAQAATSEAGWVLGLSGLGSLLLAAAGSWWLARRLARPVGELTSSLARMAAARDLTEALPRSGVSREFDELADSFDVLRMALSKAEAESEETYLGVIGTLANALDARDPYTAGHSIRVSRLSVAIAREMGLADADVETLRLGALLHDVGKIGVSDAILRKPGKLTDEEFEQIKLHPTLGARILQPLRMFDAQIAIVELHHERPDGRGYPHGLVGEAIPPAARIVHVADAFDAMTSARAYRPGRPAEAALEELQRHVDTDFDAAVVSGILALSANELANLMLDQPPEMDGESKSPLATIVPFRMRSAARTPVAMPAIQEAGRRATDRYAAS
jgi:putative nucleotidyltransferase with HDIG domain